MDVLMVAAELSPQARATAAADSISALSKAIRQLGHSVTVALPRTAGFEGTSPLLARRLSPLVVEPGVEVTVLDGQLASGVSLVLFDAPAFSEQRSVYGASGTAEGEADGARFALLARAAAALVRERRDHGKPFDVVHLHDWPAAPAAALLGTQGPPSVLTIHALDDERTFEQKTLASLGAALDEPRARRGKRVSALRLGLYAARAVTTVSHGYAEALARGPLADAVDGLAQPITGVLDGIDYAIFNPATDPALESRFDAEDPSNKGRCKTALLRGLELTVAPERPLLVLSTASRDADSVAAAVAALPRLLDLDAAIVVAGPLDGDLARTLDRLRQSNPGDLGVLPQTDGVELRRLAAAADFVLTAQGEVPCGHVELVAQRYGALPVAEALGGIPDVVVDMDAELDTGTGFTYVRDGDDALLGAVQRAVSAYGSPEFPHLRRRIMRRDLGWDRPARRYVQIYRRLLGEPSLT